MDRGQVTLCEIALRRGWPYDRHVKIGGDSCVFTGALMADTQKLDEAFERFEAALRQFEAALTRKQDTEKRAETLEHEAEALRRDRSKLAHELDLVRSKAGELVDTSKQAAGKIDAAMSRIRAVLHSNSGE